MLGNTRINSYYLDKTIEFSIHLKIGKHGVAKELNHLLLKRIQCLLYNAQLDKFFWAEALEYTSHLIKRLASTAIGAKTPLDI